MDILISKLSTLLAHPLIPWLIGVIIFAILYQQFSHRLRVRLPGGGLTAGSIVEKLFGSRFADAKRDAAVSREKRKGNYLVAGRLYEEVGRLQQAADVFIEGQEFNAAAAVMEKLGRIDRSAELYLQAGDYKKSAALFAQSGKPARAAALYQERGNNVDAARLYAQAGAWDKAADLYEKSGYAQKAAEAYEKKGDLRKAAECYERHFMENVSFSTTYSSTAVSPDQKSALMSGRLFEKAGDLTRAFQIYERGSYFKEAADVAMAERRFPKAAELYMRAEDPMSAANAYEQAGDRIKAANLRGEVAYKENRVPDAARFFQEGQDYLRAAELFESVDMLAEAAAAYEVGESFAAAGSVYVRAGLKQKAAESYERAGDLETAAKLYEEAGVGRKAMELFDRAGQSFRSGEAAAKSGDRERAVALLQRVPSDDENYRRATELLAEIFLETKRPDLAIERLQKAIAGKEIAQANLDLYYWLAVSHESAGHQDAAVEIYRKVLAEDLQFRDVSRRLQRIESGDAAPIEESDSGRMGKYEIHEKVGQGAMGEVYRAHDPVLNRDVALKVITANLAADPELQARFRREAQSAAQLNHPNIITVFDFGEQGGKAYMATELLEGQDLRHLIGTPALRDIDHVLFIVEQICEGLAYAHQKGVIHRDLKPGNVYILTNGRVKILDFGLARLGASEMTQAGTILGTPHYMAPEQVQGGTSVDHRSAIFALGTVFYEMVTGRKAFDADSLPAVLNFVMTVEPEKPSAVTPHCPVLVDRIIQKALAKDPESRYQNAAEMKAEVASMRSTLAAQGGVTHVPRLEPAPARSEAPAPRPGAHSPAVKRPAVPAAAGTRFVRREEIGKGPLGTIYRGENVKDGSIVALRFPPPELLDSKALLQPFVADLKAASQVTHPHLAKVLGFMEMEGQRCVVTDLVPGRDFGQALQAGQRLPLVQVLTLGKLLAQALSAIHGRGLVHGSIRPSNVMVAAGIVKLVDLGLGRLAQAVERPVSYEAPEKKLDVAGDMYSLAAVLYHLLTGVHPTHQQESLRVPSKILPGVPPALDQLIFQNLQAMPVVRSSSADEFLKILSRTRTG